MNQTQHSTGCIQKEKARELVCFLAPAPKSNISWMCYLIAVNLQSVSVVCTLRIKLPGLGRSADLGCSFNSLSRWPRTWFNPRELIAIYCDKQENIPSCDKNEQQCGPWSAVYLQK
jgi:hypothetical protein